MPNAARIADPIGHSPAVNWLIKGLVVGAAVGIAAVAIVGTGGLAAAAIVGGLAAGGAGIGELLSSMSWASKEVTGTILRGSSDVLFNNRPAARAHVDNAICSKHRPPNPIIATGSATVFINKMPAGRVNDKLTDSAVIVEGSPDIIIGGGTVQTDKINPENLVPWWAHAGLLVIGIGSAVILGGPIVAAFGLAGGFGGGFGGQWLGGKIFGEGSDGQKWMMLGGSIIGGAGATKGGIWFNKNYTVTTQGLGSNLGNVKITPKYPSGSVSYGELDALGRPTGVKATITQDMIGTGTSASRSIIPPGFKGGAAGQARGHLLGRQLGGSGTDPRNLVTLQQNPTNTPVMSGIEAQIRATVERGHTVEASMTPIYNGSNPAPRAVTILGKGSDGSQIGISVLNPPGI